MARATTSKSLVTPKKKIIVIPEADEDDRYCFYCAKHKSPSEFYNNPDPRVRSHLSPMCKACARELAERYQFGEAQGATKESIKTVLRLLNRPFFNVIYERAKQKVLDQTNPGESLWGAYIGFLQKDPDCRDLPWEMGDELGVAIADSDEQFSQNEIEINDDIMNELRINKKDVIRLIGYDPFVNEPVADQPLLYSKTVGFLDASPDANEDEMKLSSIVEIVKLFNQAEKINSAIADYSQTKVQLAANISTIKTLQETKKAIMSTALGLAKENGISVAHNTNKSKGSNTFAGMSKKMNEMNLREYHVNAFDVETAAGMEQVANLSNRAIMDQIQLNENDFPDMINEQREEIIRLRAIAEEAIEQGRLLLQENIDLKKVLELVDEETYKDGLTQIPVNEKQDAVIEDPIDIPIEGVIVDVSDSE